MNGRPGSGEFGSPQRFSLERAVRLLWEQQDVARHSVPRDVYLRTTTPWRRVARWAGTSSSDSEEQSEESE